MMNVFMKNIFIEIIESSYGYGFSLKKLAINYQNILINYKELARELKINSSLELSHLFYQLLWNGYFSVTKENIYSKENRMFLDLPLEIMRGHGACLEYAKLLKDYLKACNKNAALLPCVLPSNILSTILAQLKINIVNHAVTLEEDNDKLFIYDPTNLYVLNVKNDKVANIINETGKIYLKCKNNPVINGNSIILKKLYTGRIEPAFTKEEVIYSLEKIVELLNTSKCLLDDAYDNIYSDLEIIKNDTDKFSTRKRNLRKK